LAAECADVGSGSDLGRLACRGTLKLIAPRHVEPLSVPLYLIMGWAVLFNPGLLLSMPASVVTLLLA
jgi:predicted membrane channel-forming protein YqfA (hemolysin III family)